MTQTHPRTNTPYYLPIGDEIEIFHAAYDCRLPVLLKGPTGCGKTRFVEYIAHSLMKEERDQSAAIGTLAHRMRLTQQATYDRRRVRPATSKKPWET